MAIRPWRARARRLTPTDQTPPTVPEDLEATLDAPDVEVSWAASTDNVAVTGYRVYRNGNLIALRTSGQLDYVDVAPVPGSYAYQVAARDLAGNISELSPPATVVVTPPVDATPPTAPTGLIASFDGSRVNLRWTASTDAVGVELYGVYRDGVFVALRKATELSWADRPADGTYTYTVKAADAAGNLSSASTGAVVTVNTAPPPDTTPPSVPTGLTATWDGLRVNLAWNASTDAGVGLGGYRIHRDGVFLTARGPTERSWADTVEPGTYAYRVSAYDKNSNISAPTAEVSVTVAPAGFTPTADTSGVNDVTEVLRLFYAGLPPGTEEDPTIVHWPANALYRCDGTLVLESPQHIHTYGHGGRIFTDKNTSRIALGAVFVRNGEGTLWDHVKVKGTQPNATGYEVAYEGQHGFRFQAHDGGRVLDCTVENVRGDFVNFGTSTPCVGGEVTRLYGRYCGRQAISITSGTDIDVHHNILRDVTRHVIDLEPASSGAIVERVNFDDNDIDGGGTGLVGALGGEDKHVDYISIQRNTVVRGFISITAGVAGYQRHHWTVKDNVGGIDKNGDLPGSPSHSVMIFNNMRYLEITGNTQPVDPSHPSGPMYLVRVAYLVDYVISGNTVPGGGEYWIIA